MPSIGQTWVLASICAVVEMGILSTLKRLLMESNVGHACGIGSSNNGFKSFETGFNLAKFDKKIH
jgi:hypothetical protein